MTSQTPERGYMSEPGREYWEALYGAALLEVDHLKLPARIDAAEQALRQRFQYLSDGSDHLDELRAIEDALQILLVLRQTEISPEKKQR